MPPTLPDPADECYTGRLSVREAHNGHTSSTSALFVFALLVVGICSATAELSAVLLFILPLTF